MKDSFYANTGLIGLIGHPIKQSYSPFIQNVAFELKNLDYIYLAFDVPADNLTSALNGMVALGMRGLNVTLPHKEKVIPLLNEVSEEASIIGAVNTIVNDNDSLKGYNTDSNGIIETLQPYKDEITGSKVSVIGAGGSARAVIFTLVRYFKPEEITIINRTLQRADSLQNYFSLKMRYDRFNTMELFPPDIAEALRSSKLVVNASSVGMFPNMDDTLTDIEESFSSDQIVFDLIYNPPESKLLKMAKKQGANTMGGMKMLVAQAAKSFELWTGEQMPVEKISKSLELYISK